MATLKEKRDITLRIAWHYLGTPYRWGGDDPMAGFDCSGFVLMILQSVGIMPLGLDMTADGLYEYFKKQNKLTSKPEAGCLAFWSSIGSGRMRHIEMMVNNELSIGASGGGSKTMTLDDAIRQNAYIKIKPINFDDSDLYGFTNPFKGITP